MNKSKSSYSIFTGMLSILMTSSVSAQTGDFSQVEIKTHPITGNIYMNAVRRMVNEGRTLDEVIAARPTAKYDRRWDTEGPIGSAEAFITVIYNELSGRL
jgi:hypothetical protein